MRLLELYKMRLVFTKDVGENFKAGMIKDYPKSVWNRIAISAGVELKKFTKQVDELAQQFKGNAK